MSSTEKTPVIFTDAIDRLDGNEDLLREMAAITLEDLPDIRGKIDQQISEGDCQQAARTLHKLKGMLCTFEADGVALDLQDMIQVARKENATELCRMYESNSDRIDDLVAKITEFANN